MHLKGLASGPSPFVFAPPDRLVDLHHKRSGATIKSVIGRFPLLLTTLSKGNLRVFCEQKDEQIRALPPESGDLAFLGP